MAERVTIQDIADALGLSRNTVSKAINNTGILADATKKRVLQKAMEMGYKTFSYAAIQANSSIVPAGPLPDSMQAANAKTEIALFIGMFLDNSHFASTMLDKFQNDISSIGYSMTIHRVTKEQKNQLALPISFRKDNTAAIICVELFDYAYCKMLCDLDLPLLLVDAPVSTYASPLPADILLMENTSCIFQLIKKASQKGISKIGFLGQPTHCRSFFERYLAFREAMYLYSIPINETFCLTEIHEHGPQYAEYLKKHLQEMTELPELLICANDFLAIDLLVILRELGISCPGDIMLSGFDDSSEGRVVTPPITTCHIHSQIMGLSAAQMIISRIRQPNLNYRITHTETNLIYRESTRGEFS